MNILFQPCELNVTAEAIEACRADHAQYKEQEESLRLKGELPEFRPTWDFCPVQKTLQRKFHSLKIGVGHHHIEVCFLWHQNLILKFDTPKELKEKLEQWDKVHALEPFKMNISFPGAY